MSKASNASHDSQLENLVYNSPIPSSQSYAAIVEGAFLFWWRSTSTEKYYHLFFSSGACCNAADSLAPAGDEYKIMGCHSSAATGPFVDKEGNNCLAENGGTEVLGSHGKVYAPGGQDVLYNEELKRPVVCYRYGMLHLFNGPTRIRHVTISKGD